MVQRRNGAQGREARSPSTFQRFALFLTSSSLHAWSMILLGWFVVIPVWPFDQSYETAYAKIEPFRLKAVVEIGPGTGSKANQCQ